MGCVLQPPFPGRLAAVGIARRVGFRDRGLQHVRGTCMPNFQLTFLSYR